MLGFWESSGGLSGTVRRETLRQTWRQACDVSGPCEGKTVAEATCAVASDVSRSAGGQGIWASVSRDLVFQKFVCRARTDAMKSCDTNQGAAWQPRRMTTRLAVVEATTSRSTNIMQSLPSSLHYPLVATIIPLLHHYTSVPHCPLRLALSRRSIIISTSYEVHMLV
jgi:hypothetical protein